MIETMQTDLFTTLDKSKEWLEAAVRGNNNGALCPCCDRFDKVYNYCIPGSAVTSIANLCVAAKAKPDAAIHCTAFTGNSGAVAKLRHLALIYQPENQKYTGGKTGGSWAITQKGIGFVQGTIPIPSHLIIYHDKLIGVSETNKYIQEFWPNFNYRELMGAA